MADNEVKLPSEPMNGELMPCPFCGKANQDRWPCEWLDGSGANVIRCAWCHGAAPADVWNRRAHATEAVRMNQAAGGEAVAWEVRVMYGPHGPDAGKWSKWQGCDKATHDAVQRGEGFCEYETAEARALVVIGTTPPAAQVQQEAVGHIIHSADAVSRFDLTPAGLALGYGSHPVYAHPAANALGALHKLSADLRTLAGGETPDGDGVPVNVVLWAEKQLAALAQAPAVRVTDEMVKNAKAAYQAVYKSRPWDEQMMVDAIRACLEAAWLPLIAAALRSAQPECDHPQRVRLVPEAGQGGGRG